MSFFDDFKILNSISEDQYKDLLVWFSETDMNSVNSTVLLNKKCDAQEIDPDLARTLFGILFFLSEYIINQRSLDEGLHQFKAKYLDEFFEEIQDVWLKIETHKNLLLDFINRIKTFQIKKMHNNLALFKIVCDSRAVFNLERNRIIDVYHPAILTIEQSDGDNLNLELSEEQLLSMQKEIQCALDKITILKNRFNKDA